MNNLLIYLLKVCLCSGVFYLYYLLALRNKVFHQWNRFYLLAIVALSLAIPLIQIQLTTSDEGNNKAVEMLQVVQSAHYFLDNAASGTHESISTESWLSLVYIGVSVTLLVLFLVALLKIKQVIRKHPITRLEEVYFVRTQLPQSPFSFMRYIFWNDAIDPGSATGQQIFRHEMVHVHEKHSWDKVFLQIVLVPFWANPFFWLIRRELQMVHEFIADQKAVDNQDAASLAAMILESAHPGRFSSLTQHFFQTPIKRRLIMLSKLGNSKISYLSRLVALAVVITVSFAFSIRTQRQSGILSEPFTVVIDAGHGLLNGKYTGAAGQNVHEDEIVLALAHKIDALNNDPNLRIVLTRGGRESVSLTKRVEVAKANRADLFLSLHMSADVSPAPSQQSAIDIFVAAKGSAFLPQNQVAGSILREELQDVYPVSNELKQSKTAVMVLDKNTCPSILLEVGSITREKDRSFFSTPSNQERFARQVLSAIRRYAAQPPAVSTPENSQSLIPSVRDTVPPKGSRVIITYKNRKKDTLVASRKRMSEVDVEQVESVNVIKENEQVEYEVSVEESEKKSDPPLYIVDGKEYTGDMKSIDPDQIARINVLKGSHATSLYGEKGRNGVIIIKLKKKTSRAVKV